LKRVILVLPLMGALSACAGAQATRTSANTMVIDAGAAPACGSQGAAKVAAKSAAVETIRAGYDRYIITGAASQNNVSTTQMPGQFNTVGTSNYYGGGYRTYNATTTYTPGPTIVSGSHDRQLGVVMFRNGEPGAENAIDARQTLGPEWADLAKSGIHTCL
jgi:hypothetical protein